jgi:NAD dependent epimerase/dehydratase family enzyme
MGEAMLLGGARVVPERLLESGYRFRFPSLREALQALV